MIQLQDALNDLRTYLAARHGRAVYCSVRVSIMGYHVFGAGPDAVRVTLYTAEAEDDRHHHFEAPTLEAAWGLLRAHHAALDAVADPVVELPA